MLNPYTSKKNIIAKKNIMAKKNIKKVQRVAVEGVVLGETKDDKLLIGFYPDTKANLLEINGDRVYSIGEKEFLYSAREDVPSEMKTREFEDLLIELREVIDEDYCFKNGIDYNLGALCGSPMEFFAMLLISLRKLKTKKKNSPKDYSYFLAVAKL